MNSSDILKKLEELYQKEKLLKSQLSQLDLELDQTQEDIEMCELSYMYAKNKEERMKK